MSGRCTALARLWLLPLFLYTSAAMQLTSGELLFYRSLWESQRSEKGVNP